jgi:Tol biopolymer transport system component
MTAPDALATALADRYRLERQVGEGGMATVYLAEDLRHHRKVAVKVLRAELSAILGAERFLHEITTTANLQHPHILPLFDSGEAAGRVFYVMPFVEGESLRDRLARLRQLPVEEAVRIAREVADALDYAHRHGVIHRDVKPENILLHDGRAQVADFGIALAASRADGGARMTETGMSLGTPHYMSPEQAMGEREITAQSDIYALGCVLYEMLIGEPPFTGPTAQAIVARVMTEEPRSLALQRRTVPPQVEDAVLTALAKLPADRFATAAEFGAALSGGTTAARRHRPEPVAPAAGASRRLVALLGALLVATGALATWALLRRPAPAPVSWFSMNLPAGMLVGSTADPALALSRDGRTLAYLMEGASGASQLVTRRAGDPLPTPVPGSENAMGVDFSADGNWLLFVDRGLRPRKALVAGGSGVAIPAAPDLRATRIVEAPNGEFAVTLANGWLGMLRQDGTVDTLSRPDSSLGEATHDAMQVLPNGQVLVIATTSFPEGAIIVVDLARRERHAIAGTPTDVSWAKVAEGHLVWALGDGSLHAARFDPGAYRLTGAATPLNARVQVTRGTRPKVAVSAGGALAFVPQVLPSLVRVGRDGAVQPLLATPRNYHNPRLSPEGRRVLFDFSDDGRDVWVVDLRDTTLTRVSFEGDAHDGFWHPDGRSFYFASARRSGIGIFRRAADGSGTPDSVYFSGGQITLHAITPDSKLAVAARIDGFVFDLYTVDLSGPGARGTPLLQTRYDEYYPALSPDGRWLAYVSTETNRNEVYVRPFPEAGSKVLVSQGGGIEPIWSRDGRELFYRGFDTGGPRLMAAKVETRPTFRVLSRTALFDDSEYEGATPHANYDVLPDGQGFLMVRQGRFGEVQYVGNWLGLLKR